MFPVSETKNQFILRLAYAGLAADLDDIWPVNIVPGGQLFVISDTFVPAGTQARVTAAFGLGRYEILISSAPTNPCPNN